MTDRKRRKKNKLRGQRTMGAGNTKNRRGAGSRGGRGKAGSNKHKFHTLGRLKPVKYRLKAEKKGRAVQLGKIDAMLEVLLAKGKIAKEGEKYIIDSKSGIEKILSQGETKHKLIVRINASKKAIPKIIKSGGKFEYAKKNYAAEEAGFSGDEEGEDLEFEVVEGDAEQK